VKIARRSSGGRGEYELAGEVNGIRPADVFDMGISARIDWLEFQTDVVVRAQGGKPRLRRTSTSHQQIQIPRQIAALLIMPGPVREDVALKSGLPLLREDGYAIEAIAISGASHDGSRCRFILGGVTIKNESVQATFDPVTRLSRVRALWSNRHRFPAAVRHALDLHREAALAGGPLTATVEQAVQVITSYTEGDPLGRY
jgi:hypothetical protein